MPSSVGCTVSSCRRSATTAGDPSVIQMRAVLDMGMSPLALVGQVGAPSGREWATCSRSAASSGGGGAVDQLCQYKRRRAQGQSQRRTRRSVACQTILAPDFPPEAARAGAVSGSGLLLDGLALGLT